MCGVEASHFKYIKDISSRYSWVQALFRAGFFCDIGDGKRPSGLQAGRGSALPAVSAIAAYLCPSAGLSKPRRSVTGLPMGGAVFVSTVRSAPLSMRTPTS